MTSREVLAEMRALVDHRDDKGAVGERAREAFRDRFSLCADVCQGCLGITEEMVCSRAEQEWGDTSPSCLMHWRLRMVEEHGDLELAYLLDEYDTQSSLLATALDFDDQVRFQQCLDRRERLVLEILEHCDRRYGPFELHEYD